MVKEKYILDKNCIRHASNRVNHLEEYDFTSYTVIVNIAHHCDKLIFDDHLKNYYWKTLNELDDVGLIRLWVLLTSTTEKTLKWNEHVTMKVDKEIKEEDRGLVSLARSSKATLITNDINLIEKLKPNKENISERFGIKVLTPKEANIEIMKNSLDEQGRN